MAVNLISTQLPVFVSNLLCELLELEKNYCMLTETLEVVPDNHFQIKFLDRMWSKISVNQKILMFQYEVMNHEIITLPAKLLQKLYILRKPCSS